MIWILKIPKCNYLCVSVYLRKTVLPNTHHGATSPIWECMSGHQKGKTPHRLDMLTETWLVEAKKHALCGSPKPNFSYIVHWSHQHWKQCLDCCIEISRIFVGGPFINHVGIFFLEIFESPHFSGNYWHHLWFSFISGGFTDIFRIPSPIGLGLWGWSLSKRDKQ